MEGQVQKGMKPRSEEYLRVYQPAYQKAYRLTDAGKVACNRAQVRYRVSAKGKVTRARINSLRHKLHPDREKATHTVNNAIRDRRLIRLPCEICGDAKADGHYKDYSKPLDVRWLCRKHHKELHKARFK